MDTRLLCAEAGTLYATLRITWDALDPTWEGASRRTFEASYLTLFKRDAERFASAVEALAGLSSRVDELLR